MVAFEWHKPPLIVKVAEQDHRRGYNHQNQQRRRPKGIFGWLAFTSIILEIIIANSHSCMKRWENYTNSKCVSLVLIHYFDEKTQRTKGMCQTVRKIFCFYKFAYKSILSIETRLFNMNLHYKGEKHTLKFADYLAWHSRNTPAHQTWQRNQNSQQSSTAVDTWL